MFSFWYLKNVFSGINCFIMLICPPWNNFLSLPTLFSLIDCLVASKRSTGTVSSSFLLLWSAVSLSLPLSLSDRRNATNRTRARTHHVLLSTWKELWDYMGMWEEYYARNIFAKTSIITGHAPQLSLSLAKKSASVCGHASSLFPGGQTTTAHPLKLEHAACILLELQYDVASPGPGPHLPATEPTNTPSCNIQYT